MKITLDIPNTTSHTGVDTFCKSQLITCNRVKECNGVCPFEDALKHADKEANEQHMRVILKNTERPQGEWIPCSERLPSEDGQYLVFYEGTIIGSRIEIMWYGEPLMPNVDVSGKHFYRSDSEWGDIIYDEVIAWMPLPTPYREENEV